MLIPLHGSPWLSSKSLLPCSRSSAAADMTCTCILLDPAKLGRRNKVSKVRPVRWNESTHIESTNSLWTAACLHDIGQNTLHKQKWPCNDDAMTYVCFLLGSQWLDWCILLLQRNIQVYSWHATYLAASVNSLCWHDAWLKSCLSSLIPRESNGCNGWNMWTVLKCTSGPHLQLVSVGVYFSCSFTPFHQIWRTTSESTCIWLEYVRVKCHKCHKCQLSMHLSIRSQL